MSWNSEFANSGYLNEGFKLRVDGAFAENGKSILSRLCKWLIKQKRGESFLHYNHYYLLKSGSRTFELRILNDDNNECGQYYDYEGLIMTEFDKYCKRKNLLYRIDLDRNCSCFRVIEDDDF